MAIKKSSIATSFLPTQQMPLSQPQVAPQMLIGKQATQSQLGVQAGLNAGQEAVNPEAEKIGLLSKALASFSKALATPGFSGALAKLGYSLAGEGTVQQKLGETAISMTNQKSYSNYVQKLIAGQPLTQADYADLTPDQITQGRAIADTQTKLKQEQQQIDIGAKSQAASQKYMEAQSAMLPGSFEQKVAAEKDMLKQEALLKPRIEQWLDNGKIVTSQFNLDTMGWDELARSTPTPIEEARIRASYTGTKGGATEAQKGVQYRYNYNKFQKELEKEYLGKGLDITQDPTTGEIKTTWASSTARAEYNKKLYEGVWFMQGRGDLPADWLIFPHYTAGAPGTTTPLNQDVTTHRYATKDELLAAYNNDQITYEEATKIAKERGW